VRGPQELSVKVAKNNSLNTILAGAFLDLVDERPAPYFRTVDNWQKRQSKREQERDELRTQSVEERAARFAPATDEKDAANRLFTEVERLRELNPPMWAARSRPVYETLARWLEPAIHRADSLEIGVLYARQATCFYNLNRYNDWENVQRRRGLTPARDIEKSLKWDGKGNFSGHEYGWLTYVLNNS